jgi:HEAT repeat protein
MSADNYAAMSTARLLQWFVEAAKSTPTIYAKWRTVFASGMTEELVPTPERAARVATIKALAAELVARKPIPGVRQLFEDDDANVRAWAAGQLMAVDPQWGFATLQALINGLSTREALDLMQRVIEEPPSLPALKDMGDDALVARFEDAATREFATRFLDCVDDQNDIDTRNRVLGEVWDVMRELKARGLLGRLLPLLESSNVTVRREAATACLRVAEEKAIAVLEAVAADGGVNDMYAARDALEGWRKEGMAVYGV